MKHAPNGNESFSWWWVVKCELTLCSISNTFLLIYTLSVLSHPFSVKNKSVSTKQRRLNAACLVRLKPYSTFSYIFTDIISRTRKRSKAKSATNERRRSNGGEKTTERSIRVNSNLRVSQHFPSNLCQFNMMQAVKKNKTKYCTGLVWVYGRALII